MTVSEIEEERTRIKGEPEIGQFLDRCTSCGACTDACSFLGGRGAPDRLIARHDPDVFLCTGCGACAGFCPEGLKPSDALLLAKRRLLKTGQAPDRVSKAVRAARRFARWGHSQPFSHYSRTETVFWPGCSLAGMSPEAVHKTRKFLAETLGKKVGIALDCCSDPAYQIGDLDFVREACGGIRGRLERRGIKTIISACTNCVKILRGHLPEVRVEHVLTVLPHAAVKSLAGKECYLHHPCPAFHDEAVRSRARDLLGGLGAGVIEQKRPRCCRFGGNVHALSAELADASAREVLAAAGGASIVTYCMACKERFLSKGIRANHLLELLVSAMPEYRRFSPAHKWWNRFLLTLKMRLAIAWKR